MRILPIVTLFLGIILATKFTSNIWEIQTIAMQFYNSRAEAAIEEKAITTQDTDLEQQHHSNDKTNNTDNKHSNQSEEKSQTVSSKEESKKNQDDNTGFDQPSNFTEGEIVLLKNLRNKRIAL